MTDAINPPLCPVTGEPAVRLVQSIKPGLLIRLWRHSSRVDARPLLGQHHRINLWESPVGLHFFDPMIEGDHAFYTGLYSKLTFLDGWWVDHTRNEFQSAARHVSPGDRVLDVGCGSGTFRRAIPEASYVGLEPNFAEASEIEGVRNETLDQHVAAHAGSYDVACAFQVLEHLHAPGVAFSDMVRAVRPGGLVIVCVPHVPSASTRIPNFMFNAPPHHLTWWTRQALSALAERNGCSVVDIEQVPWGLQDSYLHWMARCSPIKCKDEFFSSRASWHLSLLFAYGAARVMQALRWPPGKDEGYGLLMVARRNASDSPALAPINPSEPS